MKISKNKVWISSLFFVFIFLQIVLYIKQQESIKSYGLLHDKKSYSILYAINNGKVSEAKEMLTSNLANLVMNYDKDLLLRSNSMSSLCLDWERSMKNIVLNHIKGPVFNDTEYQKNIMKNIDLIDQDCKSL